MINVSRVIKDPRFSQAFKLFRKNGRFIGGRFNQTETEYSFSGVIKPASPEDIEMIPEGDRVGGEIVIYSTSELKVSSKEGTSDEIIWNDERYKLYAISPYKDYGFYKAIAIRKESM